jgi:hypothetical protein
MCISSTMHRFGEIGLFINLTYYFWTPLCYLFFEMRKIKRISPRGTVVFPYFMTHRCIRFWAPLCLVFEIDKNKVFSRSFLLRVNFFVSTIFSATRRLGKQDRQGHSDRFWLLLYRLYGLSSSLSNKVLVSDYLLKADTHSVGQDTFRFCATPKIRSPHLHEPTTGPYPNELNPVYILAFCF